MKQHFSTVVVTGPDGAPLQRRHPKSVDRTLTQPVKAAARRGDPGGVADPVSTDSHPIEGQLALHHGRTGPDQLSAVQRPGAHERRTGHHLGRGTDRRSRPGLERGRVWRAAVGWCSCCRYCAGTRPRHRLVAQGTGRLTKGRQQRHCRRRRDTGTLARSATPARRPERTSGFWCAAHRGRTPLPHSRKDSAAPSTSAPTRSRDTVRRLAAVAILIVAGAVVALLYRGSADGGAAVQDRQITVTITAGKADPPVQRVEVGKGSTIKLTITSDVPDELHVHGYDRKAVLNPGQPATLEFRADTAGVFEIETHSAHLLLVQLVVR